MAVCSPTVFSPLALKLTKVGGRAKQTHIAVPASPSRRVVIFACGRAAAAPALFHNLGDDGKGDLLRRDGADVEAGGRAQTGELRGIEALFLQPRLQHTSLAPAADESDVGRSEEHTSELQSLMRISYAVFCLKKKKQNKQTK